MSDLEMFRAMVRATTEDDRRARATARWSRIMALCAVVAACGTLALVVLALLTYLAR